MKDKNEKPVMWQHRFFDTVTTFTKKTWQWKFHKIKSGDIILLHDSHQQTDIFLASLESFIKELHKSGFELNAISNINPI